MNNTTLCTDAEIAEMRACPDCFGLEKDFGVWEDGDVWEVFDAECVAVARCPSEALARMIAKALSVFNDFEAGGHAEHDGINLYCAKHADLGVRIHAERVQALAKNEGGET